MKNQNNNKYAGKKSRKDLVEILSSISEREKQNKVRRLRYVIYCRKSTDDATRQVGSLGDQLAVCEKLARDNGLWVVDRIQEAESAKYSGKRTEFASILENIKGGKYDGIISWHPDRLSSKYEGCWRGD